MASFREISSRSNERFKRLLSLSVSSRSRHAGGLALIEGEHLLQAYLERHGRSAGEVYLPRRSQDRAVLCELSRGVSDEVFLIDDALFDQVSGVEHGPGPIALVPVPAAPLPDRLDEDAVYLDRIQDPGNVGTILRSAAAFGVRRVIAAPGTVSLWSPKVLRAAMGAHFALALHEAIGPAQLLASSGAAVFCATSARAPQAIHQCDLRGHRVWLLGNEGQGLCSELESAPGVQRLAIAQGPQIESLNVGVAASICLYEQFRQRTVDGPR